MSDVACGFTWGECPARVPLPPEFKRKPHICRKKVIEGGGSFPLTVSFRLDHKGEHECWHCSEVYKPKPEDGNASLIDFLGAI